MRRVSFLLVFISSISLLMFAQSLEEVAEIRQKKLELILRFQDLRTIFDGKLISFLSDNDPIVRERAVRAFGSIQDTSVLHLLVNSLTDASPQVQFAAAFAIGQTAQQLSKKNRQILEHDLIWARLDRMSSLGKGKASAADRLI